MRATPDAHEGPRQSDRSPTRGRLHITRTAPQGTAGMTRAGGSPQLDLHPRREQVAHCDVQIRPEIPVSLSRLPIDLAATTGRQRSPRERLTPKSPLTRRK